MYITYSYIMKIISSTYFTLLTCLNPQSNLNIMKIENIKLKVLSKFKHKCLWLSMT